MDEWSVSGGSGQHPPGEIHTDDSVAGVLQVPAQVSGPAGQIEHGGTGRQAQSEHRTVPPPDVEAERHDSVD